MSTGTVPGAGRGQAEAPRISPFDALAADYDRTFSRSLLGGLYRRAVWARVDGAVAPGARVLDLGCGTGEDALHLARLGARVLAIDASPAMVAEAERKVAAARGAERERVELRLLGAEEVGTLASESPFDLVLSDFGVLNCVGDLAAAAGGLARCTRPGARVFLAVMGPLVPWEWGWYLLRGDPGRAFRRLRAGGARWRGLRVGYPTIAALARAFRPSFTTVRASALGALLPPSYAEAWAGRHPRLIALLDRWERRLEAVPPLPWLADHYLLELVRR